MNPKKKIVSKILIDGDNEPRAKLYNIITRKLLNMIFPSVFDISNRIVDSCTSLYFFINIIRSPKTAFTKLLIHLKGKENINFIMSLDVFL